jgi:hypothetical protein
MSRVCFARPLILRKVSEPIPASAAGFTEGSVRARPKRQHELATVEPERA